MDAEVSTVLVVDDSSTMRRIVGGVVEHLGHAVIGAEDGREGLEVLQKNAQVALVVSDHNMPRLRGLGMVERMRELDAQVSSTALQVAAHSSTGLHR